MLPGSLRSSVGFPAPPASLHRTLLSLDRHSALVHPGGDFSAEALGQGGQGSRVRPVPSPPRELFGSVQGDLPPQHGHPEMLGGSNSHLRFSSEAGISCSFTNSSKY